MVLQKNLKELADEKIPLKSSGLLLLSGLSTDEIFELKTEWLSMSLNRKLEILSRLDELSGDNLDLDFTAIYRASLSDDDEIIREQATKGLWDSDDRVLVRPLISLLKTDPSPRVKAAAAISLSKFVEMANSNKLLERDGDRIRAALLAIIESTEEELEVRRRAIEAVAPFNSPQIDQIIKDSYEGDDSKLRQSAIFAMGRSSDTKWVPIVLKELQHEDPALRYEAASAIGLLGDETAIPDVIMLIQDEDFLVQCSAIQALGTIGGVLAKQALLQCLKLGDEGLEIAAQEALDSIEFQEDPLGFRPGR